MSGMTLADLEASLMASDDSDDGIDLPSWTDEPKKKKATPKPKPASASPAAPSRSPAAAKTPSPKPSSSSSLSSSSSPSLKPATPQTAAKKTPIRAKGLRSPGSVKTPISARKLKPPSGGGSGLKAPSSASRMKSPASSSKQPAKIYKRSKHDLSGLTGREEKTLKDMYDHYEQGGLSLMQWKNFVKELGIGCGAATAEEAFLTGNGGLKRGEFPGFIQAFANLSLVWCSKRGSGSPDSIVAARELMEELIKTNTQEEEEDEQEASRKKEESAAVARLKAKERLALTKKKLAEKEERDKDQAAAEAARQEQRRLQAEEDGASSAQKAEQRRIAAHKRFIKAKARLAREKREKAEQQQAREEAEKANSLEERSLAMARMRAEARSRAVHRSRQHTERMRDEEQAALQEEESQTGAVATSPEQKLAALRKVQDRLRKAKQERETAEREQEEEEERERERLEEVNKRRNQLSAEGISKAYARSKARIKQQLREEEEERQRIVAEAAKRSAENAEIIKRGTANVVKRVETATTKGGRIEFDEEILEDLRKMWKPFIVKDRLHKANWPTLLNKYKLVDGVNLKNSHLDAIYSKSSVKGVKGLGIKAFGKAMAKVGSIRFPDKKDPLLQHALMRVIYKTVRKYDLEEYEARKQQLKEQKKEFKQDQARIASAQYRAEEKKKAAEAERMAREQEARKRRLEEQLARLEEEEAERAAKRAKEEEEAAAKVVVDREREAAAKEQKLQALKEKKIEIEEDRKEREEKLRLREERLAKKMDKEAKEKQRVEAEKAARAAAAAAEGMKKAALRLSDRKKNEVHLGLSDEDTESLTVVFKHYCLNRVDMSRSDWLNCVISFGFQRKKVTKGDLEECFEKAMINAKGSHGLQFENYLDALLLLAHKLFPKHTKAQSPEVMQKLLNAIFGDDEEEDSEDEDQTDTGASHAETLEQRAERLQRYREKARRERQERLQKEAEAEAQKALEAEQAELRAAEDKEKAITARKRAAERLAKRKKEEFTISSGNKEHLEILFKHFKLRPVGLSRSDWLNCVSTILQYDEENEEGGSVSKLEAANFFDDGVQTSVNKHGLDFSSFCVAMSFIGMSLYPSASGQTEGLAKLVKMLDF